MKSKLSTPELTVADMTKTIQDKGGTVALKFTSNAQWSVDTTGIGWLHLSQTTGNSGNATISLTAENNATGMSRLALITLNAANGQSRRIKVFQDAHIYPSYNTSPIAPDSTGMGSTAMELSSRITMGWNVYNTMEAPGGETGWGNPPITQQLFDLIKSTGMNAVRIPIRYSDHIINQATAQIDPTWLARVHQVVQYAFKDNMYVTINIHYDPGTELTGALQDTANAKHKAYWEQIATAMRDFDEHLMFASLNETTGVDVASTTTLMRYHQTFIDAVRSTGGRNAYRVLVIQSPSTSLDAANSLLNPANVYKTPSLPKDSVANRMMVEIHYYSPPQFCIIGGNDNSTIPQDATWGKELYFWGKDYHTKNPLFLDRNCSPSSEEGYMDSILSTVKSRFTEKGIPLVLGEFQPSTHFGRLAGYPADSILSIRSTMHYDAFLVEKAKANGVIPYLWAGIFNRPATNGVPTGPAVVGDPQALDSVKSGVNKGVIDFGSGAHF